MNNNTTDDKSIRCTVSFRLNGDLYNYVNDRMQRFHHSNMSETIRSIIEMVMLNDNNASEYGDMLGVLSRQKIKVENYDNLIKYVAFLDSKLNPQNDQDMDSTTYDFDEPESMVPEMSDPTSSSNPTTARCIQQQPNYFMGQKPVVVQKRNSVPVQDYVRVVEPKPIPKQVSNQPQSPLAEFGLSKIVKQTTDDKLAADEKIQLKTRWTALATGPSIRDGSCKFLADCNTHNEMVAKIRAELDYWNERGWALTTKQILAMDTRVEIYNKRIHASIRYEGLKKFLYDTAIKNEKRDIPVDDISFTPMSYWKAIGGLVAPDDAETEEGDDE